MNGGWMILVASLSLIIGAWHGTRVTEERYADALVWADDSCREAVTLFED